MGWTKSQLVVKAFSKIGYASYVFDLQAEQLEEGLSTMDAMIASWAGEGIRIGYNMASTPSTSKLVDDSGIIDAANEAVYMNLAKRLAGVVGKQLAPDDKAIADESYKRLFNKAISANTPEMQLPSTMPRGAGNKPWRNSTNPFVGIPTDNLQVGPDDFLVFK